MGTGFSQTVTIDTDQDDHCDWQQISFCFVGSRVSSVKIMLKESSSGDGNVLAIDDVSVQELRDPSLTITLELLDSDQIFGMATIYAKDRTLLEECEGLYYWFVLTLQSYPGGKFTVNWSAPRGWGNSLHSVRANRYAVGPPWGATIVPWSTTLFPGFVFMPNTFYAIGMVTTRCCEACLIHGWTYYVVYPSFFRKQNSGWASNGRTYIINYGLTEMDRLYMEEWVGRSEPSSLDKDASKSRDQLP